MAANNTTVNYVFISSLNIQCIQYRIITFGVSHHYTYTAVSTTKRNSWVYPLLYIMGVHIDTSSRISKNAQVFFMTFCLNTPVIKGFFFILISLYKCTASNIPKKIGLLIKVKSMAS